MSAMFRHCEERSDAAIHGSSWKPVYAVSVGENVAPWIAAPFGLAMTTFVLGFG